MNSTILDVGCGPGWVSHYLSKLGYRVLGIDISKELIEVAEQRIKNDPFPPYEGVPFTVEFIVHDIEDMPLKTDHLFDAAFIVATLHHFFDPLSVLKNVSKTLKDDGVIIILEGSAPDENSPGFENNIDTMEKYDTLERPFTREQMIKLFKLTGFNYYKFFYPINGFFEQNHINAEGIKNLILNGEGWNISIASRDARAIKRISKYENNDHEIHSLEGFYWEEKKMDGVVFRWSPCKSSIFLNSAERLTVNISSHFSKITSKTQMVYVYIDDLMYEKIILTAQKDEAELVIKNLKNNKKIDFFSDSVFSPKWYGGKDERLLSFMLEIKESQ